MPWFEVLLDAPVLAKLRYEAKHGHYGSPHMQAYDRLLGAAGMRAEDVDKKCATEHGWVYWRKRVKLELTREQAEALLACRPRELIEIPKPGRKRKGLTSPGTLC